MNIFIFDKLVLSKVLDQSWVLKLTAFLDLANKGNMRVIVRLFISGRNSTKDALVKLEVALE